MKKFKRFLINLYMRICNLLFFNKNKIIFQSFGGKNYSGNPKAIFELLIKQKELTKVKSIWAFKKPELHKELTSNNVKTTKLYSLTYFFHLATAKVWIDDFEKAIFLYKNKRQIYIQSFHGDRGFKKILNDVAILPRFEENHCNYIITGSVYAERLMKSSLNYNGEFLKIGCPRNDVLFVNDPKHIAKIKRSLKIDGNPKVLMYAPTFRDNQNASDNNIHPLLPLLKLRKLLELKTNERWFLLVRSHPHKKEFGVPTPEVDFIDVSAYDDMAELLLITDFLVSDYSSCAGDFVLTPKPVVLFQYDIDRYVSSDRELNIDVKDTHFLLAHNEDELLEKAITAISEPPGSRNKQILSFYGSYEDGTATKKVIINLIEIFNP